MNKAILYLRRHWTINMRACKPLCEHVNHYATKQLKNLGGLSLEASCLYNSLREGDNIRNYHIIKHSRQTSTNKIVLSKVL